MPPFTDRRYYLTNKRLQVMLRPGTHGRLRGCCRALAIEPFASFSLRSDGGPSDLTVLQLKEYGDSPTYFIEECSEIEQSEWV